MENKQADSDTMSVVLESSPTLPLTTANSTTSATSTTSPIYRQRCVETASSVIPKTTRMSKQAERRLSELTINKLKIKSIGLIGREKETEILKDRLQTLIGVEDENYDDDDESNDSSSMKMSKIKKQLIFIKGLAGVGKTSLARAIKKDVNNSTKKGYFAEGKFDLNEAKDQPYSGISKAYSGLIQELWTSDRNSLLGIGERLSEALGSEVEPLTFLIPELEDAVPQYSTSTFSEGDMDGMQDRWKFSFRLLTRLLTANVKPLVILLDDLQWADQASMDLIECLITDTQNVNPLMVIGCYRSNEVTEDSILSKSIKVLTGKTANYFFDTTEFEVASFGETEVNQIIMKMMDIDDEQSTNDLAALCFQRTLGNPFFVIEFLSMLHQEGLIQFNLGTMKWSFDISTIAEKTVSTDNVVELLRSRLQKMPADVQMLIQFAACLGPTLSLPILKVLWQNMSIVGSKGFQSDNLPMLIRIIEEEMLIEVWAGDKYRWVHDRVQEAALSLVQNDEASFKYDIGKALYLNLGGKELDDVLFDVVDLLSCNKEIRSTKFSTLCLEAGKKAKRLSAFLSSMRYIKNGIGMLPDDSWESHQSLTLELYTMGAQIELALGHIEQSKYYCEAVVRRDDLGMKAKVPLRMAEITRLASVELKYPEAAETCLALLKDINYRFIWNRSLIMIQALSALSSTVKAVKKQPRDFYLSLGSMDEGNKIVVGILERLMISSFHTQNVMQLVLCVCHIVQLTLRHGLCEFSAPHFASLGNVHILIFRRYKDAQMFREVSLSMQSHIGRTRAPETFLNVYNFCLAWTLRFDTCTEVFYEGYMKGMQSGETEYAMWCLAKHFLSLPYFLGKSIDRILEACPNITRAMEEVSQTSQFTSGKCYWQMFLMLQTPLYGHDRHPIILRGDVYDIDACDGDKPLLGVHNYLECQLLLFYDDPSAADRAIRDAEVFAKASPGVFEEMIEMFHRAISLYVAARRTKKRKYKQHAKKIRKALHKLKKEGVPNVVYYCIFLDAEHAALHGKHEDANILYKEAIRFAARSGYLHHAGLFNELYSDFLLRAIGAKTDARYRLEEAIRYYTDWGALGVVDRLRKSGLLKG